MINGAHVILFTGDPEGLRAWFRDVLGMPWVDAGGGWLIFALPPAEVAIHPADEVPAQQGGRMLHQLYLMCDSLESTVSDLRARGVEVGPITDQGWGLLTALTVPGGGELGLYEPRHPSPLRTGTGVPG
ncbi:MAG TPA: VOC family protein [Candidatus Binatia bacterium]|nr:VOC family protein [Candidatus Binatia bacterium]